MRGKKIRPEKHPCCYHKWDITRIEINNEQILTKTIYTHVNKNNQTIAFSINLIIKYVSYNAHILKYIYWLFCAAKREKTILVFFFLFLGVSSVLVIPKNRGKWCHPLFFSRFFFFWIVNPPFVCSPIYFLATFCFGCWIIVALAWSDVKNLQKKKQKITPHRFVCFSRVCTCVSFFVCFLV